jgi:hypothetical protein
MTSGFRTLSRTPTAVVYFVDGQLAMKTNDAEIRGHRLHSRQHRVEILNTWTDQEALPMAPLFAQQCRCNSRIRKRSDLRDDRKSMNGRRGNDAEIPEARDTCRESPRNWRGAHPKDMDTLGQL